MSIFRRRRRVEAETGPGFLAGEARALQTSVRQALTATERAGRQPTPVDLTVDTGRGTLLVVVCRNVVVGFVPEEHAAPLAAQHTRAAGAPLVTAGWLYPDGDLWRVWVGEAPAAGFPAAPPDADTMAAPEVTMFGIPLRGFGNPDA